MALLSLMLAIGATGCGSVGFLWTGVVGQPDHFSPALAKFSARADRLCERGLHVAERNALRVVEDKARLYVKHGTLKAFKGALRRQELNTMLMPAWQKRLEKVRHLMPGSDGDRIDATLATIEANARKAARLSAFYFLSSGNPMRVTRELAGAYGIESCAILYRHQGLYERGTANPAVRLVPHRR